MSRLHFPASFVARWNHGIEFQPMESEWTGCVLWWHWVLEWQWRQWLHQSLLTPLGCSHLMSYQLASHLKPMRGLMAPYWNHTLPSIGTTILSNLNEQSSFHASPASTIGPFQNILPWKVTVVLLKPKASHLIILFNIFPWMSTTRMV